jgi:hypothetical protein
MTEGVGSSFEAVIHNATQDDPIYLFTFPCNDCYVMTRIHTGLNEIPGGLPLKRSMAPYPTENEDCVHGLLAESLRVFLWFTAKYSTPSAIKMEPDAKSEVGSRGPAGRDDQEIRTASPRDFLKYKSHV